MSRSPLVPTHQHVPASSGVSLEVPSHRNSHIVSRFIRMLEVLQPEIPLARAPHTKVFYLVRVGGFSFLVVRSAYRLELFLFS